MAENHKLKLYVAGDTARSRAAVSGLQKLLDTAGLSDACELLVIDVLEAPQQAEADKVLAVPMLISDSPPSRLLVGDMSDSKKVLQALNLIP